MAIVTFLSIRLHVSSNGHSTQSTRAKSVFKITMDYEGLVCLVEERKPLYDQSDPLYHDRNVQDLQWKKVGDKMNISETVRLNTDEMNSPRNQKNSDGENGAVKSISHPLVPPDGGWGWIMVIGNSFLMCVSMSVTYCFGMVYVYLVQKGYSNTEVALVPALMNAFANLLAPVSTALSRYYSHRRLAMIGTILLSLGLLLCSFSDHIVWFYLCYGVIIGLGNSMALPQGFLLSQKYFHNKRVAANGVSMLGGSLGFMTIPLLLSWLVQEYSYQGAFVLWSGVVLHGLIGVSLFQPVQWHMKPSKMIPLHVITAKQNRMSLTEVPEGDEELTGNDIGDVDSSLNADPQVLNDITEGSAKETPVTGEDQEDKNEPDQATFDGRKVLLRKSSAQRIRTSSYRASACEIFGTNDVLDGFGSSLSVKIEKLKIQDEENRKNINKTESAPLDYCLCCGITFPRLGDIINFRLFKHPAFVISALSSICNRMVYMCFVTYLPALALEISITKNSSYLFSCIAIFELLAKIITSIISDLGFMPRRYFIIIAGVGSCISIFCITFARGFWGLAICCSCYGYCVGTTMCVGPVLLVEYLGLKLLPYSYGLLLFMNGIGGLLIFGLTGVLNDLAGDYLTTYWGLSCLVILPSIMWSIINCFPTVRSDSAKSPA